MSRLVTFTETIKVYFKNAQHNNTYTFIRHKDRQYKIFIYIL